MYLGSEKIDVYAVKAMGYQLARTLIRFFFSWSRESLPKNADNRD